MCLALVGGSRWRRHELFKCTQAELVSYSRLSQNTVQRATRALREAGLVEVVRQGRGTALWRQPFPPPTVTAEELSL